MHYTECHSRASGSRHKCVGSLNPVNVEQHLIRSTLYGAAAFGVCRVMTPCVSLKSNVKASTDLNGPQQQHRAASAQKESIEGQLYWQCDAIILHILEA